MLKITKLLQGRGKNLGVRSNTKLKKLFFNWKKRMISIIALTLMVSILPILSSQNSEAAVSTFTKKLHFRNVRAEQADSIRKVEYEALMVLITKKKNEVKIAQFIKRLAIRESSGDWKVVNRFGYVGKYQFGIAARKTVNAPKFTVKQFIKNPYIWPEDQQDKAAIKLMRVNYRYLNQFFNEPGDELHSFINETFTLRDRSKVKITTAGLLAASHLVGPKLVRSFLNTRGYIDKKDGNGTKCSDYMKHFDEHTFVMN